jgi:hypothetical protein
MLKLWEKHSICPSQKSINFQDDFKTLTFHILNLAGFGVRIQWPGLRKHYAQRDGVYTENNKDGTNEDESQGMRFGHAMLTVVDNLKDLFIYPRWFLSCKPFWRGLLNGA